MIEFKKGRGPDKKKRRRRSLGQRISGLKKSVKRKVAKEKIKRKVGNALEKTGSLAAKIGAGVAVAGTAALAARRGSQVIKDTAKGVSAIKRGIQKANEERLARKASRAKGPLQLQKKAPPVEPMSSQKANLQKNISQIRGTISNLGAANKKAPKIMSEISQQSSNRRQARSNPPRRRKKTS